MRILKGVMRHMLTKPPVGYEILKFSEQFEKWKEQEKMDAETEAKAAQDKAARQMIEKAKRQSKRAEVKKEAEVKVEAKAAPTKAELGKEIDKLISDETIGL